MNSKLAVAEIDKVPPEIENDPAELRNILDLERKAQRDAAMQRAAEAGDIEALRLLRESSAATDEK